MGGAKVSRQREKGTWMETRAVEHGNARLGGDGLYRAALSGAADKGDVHGLRMNGKKVVVECKNEARYDIPGWLREAEAERGNADAEYGVVLFHLKGVGAKRFGENAVVMTYDTFLGMVAGAWTCSSEEERWL